MDIKKRMTELMQERGWTEARLAKNSGLPPSTVSEILHHNTMPRLKTLESICTGLGVSMSQFFQEKDSDMMIPNCEQAALLDTWTELSKNQRAALLELMQAIAKQKRQAAVLLQETEG